MTDRTQGAHVPSVTEEITRLDTVLTRLGADSASQGFTVLAAEVLDEMSAHPVAVVDALGWPHRRLADAVAALLRANDDLDLDDKHFEAFAANLGMPMEAVDSIFEVVAAINASALRRFVDSLSWFSPRLIDTTVLSQAPTAAGYIMVPVDAHRLSGYQIFGGPRTAQAALEVLVEVPGFPDLRITEDEDSWILRWGVGVPDLPALSAPDQDWARSDLVEGRLYGYHDHAIGEFLSRQFSHAVIDQVMGAT